MTSFWAVARRLSGATRGSIVLLVGLIALTAGFVELSVSAARRTESSYTRFVEWADPPTVVTGGASDDIGAIGDRLAEITSLPSVEHWARSEAVDVTSIELSDGRRTSAPRLNVGAVGSSSAGERDRFRLLTGHVPSPDDVHEVMTDFLTADAFGLDVGDQLTLVMGDGTRWPVTLAGVVSVVGSFPTIAGFTFSTLMLPHGFAEQHPDWIDPYGAGAGLWVRGGTAGIDQLVSEMDAAGLGGVDLQAVAIIEQGANKVVRLQAFGLWLAAAIALVTGTVVIAQVLARQRNRAGHDVATARALGLVTRQAVIGSAVADASIAVAGALLGAGISVALSPLTPFGLARKVEPDPGVWVDAMVLAAGIVLTAMVVIAIGILSTVMLLHRQSPRSAPPQLSASRVGGLLAEPLGTGWRIAFGHRRGVALALAPATLTVIAFVVVATSVHDVSRLPQRPELTGGSWDAAVFVEDPASAATVDRVLRTQPDVAAVARGGWTGVRVAGLDVYTQILQPDAGVEPAIVRGRAPVGENEIALGKALLQQLATDVGDTVTVSFDEESGAGAATWRVVGEVIVASPLFQSITPDGGGLISDAAYDRWLDHGPLPFLVSFRDGVAPQEGLDAALAPMPHIDGLFAFARSTRGDVVALDSMVALPWILVGFLGLLTVASLAQWSILSSRRERHRAAVLRALGLTGSQVSTAFVVAALLVAGASCILGVTIGAVVAGAVWDAIAGWLIVVPAATIPWRLCSTIVAVTTIVAMAIAVWTSRRHAGSPAPQLRVE